MLFAGAGGGVAVSDVVCVVARVPANSAGLAGAGGAVGVGVGGGGAAAGVGGGMAMVMGGYIAMVRWIIRVPLHHVV